MTGGPDPANEAPRAPPDASARVVRNAAWLAGGTPGTRENGETGDALERFLANLGDSFDFRYELLCGLHGLIPYV